MEGVSKMDVQRIIANKTFQDLVEIIDSTGIFKLKKKNNYFDSRIKYVESNVSLEKADIIFNVKEALDLQLSDEFALSFLKEELKIPEVKQEMLSSFVRMCNIFFFKRNLGDSEENICLPKLAGVIGSGNYVRLKDIIKESMCQEIEALMFRNYFSDEDDSIYKIKKIVFKKLSNKIENNLLEVDEKLNDYLGNMKWPAAFDK